MEAATAAWSGGEMGRTRFGGVGGCVEVDVWHEMKQQVERCSPGRALGNNDGTEPASFGRVREGLGR